MEHEKAARKLFRNYEIRCTLDLENTQKYSFIEECEIFIAGLSKAYFEDTACKKGMNRGNSIFQTFNMETISGVRQDNFKRLARKILSHDWIKIHIQRLKHWLFCLSYVHGFFSNRRCSMHYITQCLNTLEIMLLIISEWKYHFYLLNKTLYFTAENMIK